MYISSDYDKDEAPVNRPNHFNQCKADYISFIVRYKLPNAATIFL